MYHVNVCAFGILWIEIENKQTPLKKDQDQKCRERERERERERTIRSVGAFPLVHLPVSFFPIKALPYGRKLHFPRVFRWLLLPVSMIESPKAIIAGMVAFPGSFITALVLLKRTKAMRLNNTIAEEEEEDNFLKRKCIILARRIFACSQLR